MTVNIDIHDAQARFEYLLERVAKGDRVVISKAGTPIADLVPHRGTEVNSGGLKGQFGYDHETFDD